MFLVLLLLMIFPSAICDFRWFTCNSDSNYTEGSLYSTNLNLVVNNLSHNAPLNSGFNTSSHGQSPNKVYGLLQCMGNVSAARCSNCSREANNITRELCPNARGAEVWMKDCFLRYDNSNFISTLDTTFYLLENTQNVTSNMEGFISTTSSLLSNLSDQALHPANKGYAVGSAKYSTSNEVYGLVQCWRDISVKDCRSCLFEATQQLEQCCSSRQGAQAMSGSCTVRYEIYPFVDSGELSPSPGASTPSPTPDTEMFLMKSSKSISGNIQSFVSTTFSLLSNMSDLANAAAHKGVAVSKSAKYSTSDKVYGLVQCRRDLSKEGCTSCLFKERQMLKQCCSSRELAQVISESCTVGYGINQTFYLVRSLSPIEVSSSPPPLSSPSTLISPPVAPGWTKATSQSKPS